MWMAELLRFLLPGTRLIGGRKLRLADFAGWFFLSFSNLPPLQNLVLGLFFHQCTPLDSFAADITWAVLMDDENKSISPNWELNNSA